MYRWWVDTRDPILTPHPASLAPRRSALGELRGLGNGHPYPGSLVNGNVALTDARITRVNLDNMVHGTTIQILFGEAYEMTEMAMRHNRSTGGKP